MRAAALFGLLVFFIGCASSKLYRDAGPQNLLVASSAESGIRGALHVHEVDPVCGARYLGTVKLDARSVAIGLAYEQPSYLVFSVEGASGFDPVGALVKPRTGHRYEVELKRRGNTYDVRLRETDTMGNEQQLALLDLAQCRRV